MTRCLCLHGQPEIINVNFEDRRPQSHIFGENGSPGGFSLTVLWQSSVFLSFFLFLFLCVSFFQFFPFSFSTTIRFLSISGKRLLFFFFLSFPDFLFWDEQCTVFWFRFGFREAHWFETCGYRFEEGVGADVQTRDTGRKGSGDL